MPNRHNFPSKGIGYGMIYANKVRLGLAEVGSDRAEWCSKNCQDKWGWYYEFGDGAAVMTFNSEKDKFAFSMVWAEFDK